MPVWLKVLLVIVTVHRATRLAVADEIPLAKAPRDWVIARLDPPGRRPPWGKFGTSIAYLVDCPWCMSVWVGAAVVWATSRWVGLPAPVLVWAAASTVTGLIASWESEHEQRWKLNDQAIKSKTGPR